MITRACLPMNNKLPYRDESSDTRIMRFASGAEYTAAQLADRRATAMAGITLIAHVQGLRLEVQVQPGKPIVTFLSDEELVKPKYQGRGFRAGQNVLCPSGQIGIWILQNCAKSLDKDHLLDVIAFGDDSLRHRLAEIRRRERDRQQQESEATN